LKKNYQDFGGSQDKPGFQHKSCLQLGKIKVSSISS